jgi:hypothetical protein
MNKQWIYRNGEKPFSVTEIVMPDGEIFFTSVRKDGYLFNHNPAGGLRHYSVNNSFDLIPYEPYSDFKIDDAVYVSNSKIVGRETPRHFAGLSDDGRPVAFPGGLTSFTHKPSDCGLITWQFCEKASKEDK